LLLSTIKDAETSQRGFLLTGDPEYLEPYQNALGIYAKQLLLLRRLAQDNLLQIRHIDEVEPLIENRLTIAKASIELRRNNDM
jgi:methyl-accepting chemotaxis protein